MVGRIYIVEDDRVLSYELARLLELNGYEVGVCTDFAHAAESALEFSPDCILLDLLLPNADGQMICRNIRSRSDVPIIILTSANDEFTEVMCLNLGAHDFIAKPYRPAVLFARLAAIIQRYNMSSEAASQLEHAGVVLDLGKSEIYYEDARASLTRNEQRILALLMRNIGTIVSRQEIMCDLWESDAFVDDNTLTVNVNRLRKALTSIGVPDDFLQTRRALGYVIQK